MKWKTHKLATATIVLGITGNPLWTALAVGGSILPDSIEYMIYGSNVPFHRHRKWSHWPVLYGILAIMFFILARIFPDYNILNSISISNVKNLFIIFQREISVVHALPGILFWFCMGALFHIVEDAVSGKVPLLNPEKKNFGIRLVRTASELENFLFFALLIAFGYVVKWRMGI